MEKPLHKKNMRTLLLDLDETLIHNVNASIAHSV